MQDATHDCDLSHRSLEKCQLLLPTPCLKYARRRRNIDTRKQALEETKKILKKRKTGKSAVALGASLGCEDAMDTYDSLDAEEALKLRGALLAKEAAEVATERKGLEREAQMHYLELKLVSA